MLKFILIIAAAAVSFSTHAYKYKKDRAHFSISYSNYDDVRLRSGTDVNVNNSIDFEFGIRFRRLFRTFLAASVGEKGLQRELGVGFRVDLPGFFLIDAKIQDFIKKGMQRPINTSFFVIGNQARFENEQGALVIDSFATRFGLSLSWFPLSKSIVYIRGDLGVYTVGGNSHALYGLGVGMAF